MPIADLVSELAGEWRAATRHPFLASVRDGTVPPVSFDTWLAQDAHFVADLLSFQARLLARAPQPARAVLAGGLVALVEELAWFEVRAGERGLDAGAPRLPATERYATLLARLDTGEPGAALAALWAVERTYLEAWSSASPGAPEYREFVAHWTTAEFAAYVAELERSVDASLPAGDPPQDVVAAVADVLRAESAFWDMATSSTATAAG